MSHPRNEAIFKDESGLEGVFRLAEMHSLVAAIGDKLGFEMTGENTGGR